MRSLRVLSVASEIYPLIKTGGLADVAGALPIALKAKDVETCTLVPGYPAVLASLRTAETVLDWANFFGGTARLLRGSHGEDWPANPDDRPSLTRWQPQRATEIGGPRGRIGSGRECARHGLPVFGGVRV